MSGQRKEGRRSARKGQNNVLFAGLVSIHSAVKFPRNSQNCGQIRFRRLSSSPNRLRSSLCSGAHRAPQLPLPAVKICDAVDKDYAPRGIIPLPDPEASLRVSESCYVEGFSQYTIEIREREKYLFLNRQIFLAYKTVAFWSKTGIIILNSYIAKLNWRL